MNNFVLSNSFDDTSVNTCSFAFFSVYNVLNNFLKKNNTSPMPPVFSSFHHSLSSQHSQSIQNNRPCKMLSVAQKYLFLIYFSVDKTLLKYCIVLLGFYLSSCNVLNLTDVIFKQVSWQICLSMVFIHFFLRLPLMLHA